MTFLLIKISSGHDLQAIPNKSPPTVFWEILGWSEGKLELNDASPACWSHRQKNHQKFRKIKWNLQNFPYADF